MGVLDLAVPGGVRRRTSSPSLDAAELGASGSAIESAGISGPTPCLLTITAMLLASCTADRASADTAVETLHQQYNANDFQTMYARAAEQFRSATPEDDWVRFLTAVRRKAGAVASTSQTSSRVDPSISC